MAYDESGGIGNHKEKQEKRVACLKRMVLALYGAGSNLLHSVSGISDFVQYPVLIVRLVRTDQQCCVCGAEELSGAAS